MKVVLLEDVRKVGKKGDVVNVSDGYGQNFLIKNGFALLATQNNIDSLSKKLTEDNHNINVFAKYGGSGYVQVGRFTVSHIAD